jgi:hypothetical protein
MALEIARLIIGALAAYAATGAFVAAVFLVIGIGRIDGQARGSHLFRLLLVPGTVLLWPVVLLRWHARER